MTKPGRAVMQALADLPPNAAIVVDFDETLWLRNSTETFLDSVRPRWLAALVLRFLEMVEPWSFLPGPDRQRVWRDWIRVVAMVVICPWSLVSWRARASKVASQHWNLELVRALEDHAARDTYILTNGFRLIVAPMLDDLRPNRPLLLAAPLLTGFRWRRIGKLQVAMLELGADRLAESVVITDNDEDSELLAAAGHGLHLQWPDARYERAIRDAYVPLDYLENVKRPGARWFARSVLADELPIILLAYAWFADQPLWAIPVLVFGVLSFWTIYEAGYVENDRFGQKFESDPVLTKEFLAGGAEKYSERGAWLYAVLLAAVAAAVMALSSGPQPKRTIFWFFDASPQWPLLLVEDLVAWVLFLAGVRLLFHVYNRLPKQDRVVPHLLLQLTKCVGFMLWFDLEIPGVALLLAYAVSRWLPYFLYRYGRPDQLWAAPEKALRLVLFLVFLGMFATSEVDLGWGDTVPISMMTVLLAYRVVRSRSG